MKAISSKLKLTLNKGETKGSKSYGNVANGATDVNLKEAAEILGALQTHELSYISRIDEKVIGGSGAAE